LNQYPKITDPSISKFAKRILDVVSDSTDSKLVITAAHFLHYSSANNYVWSEELTSLCKNIPLVDEGGKIIRVQGSLKFLQPASTNNWAKLMGRNPLTTMGFSTLSEGHLTLPSCAGALMYSVNDLVSFFRRYLDVVDTLDLFPSNANLSGVSHALTKENAFLLLQWIQYLKKNQKMLDAFIHGILEGILVGLQVT
jgi:hypothetical protein